MTPLSNTINPIAIQSQSNRNPIVNMSQEMNVEIAQVEVAVVEKKPKLSHKNKEYAAVVFWSMSTFAAAGLITYEQLAACLVESKMYSPVEEQIEHFDSFTEEKKDVFKAVAKDVREHNKPPKAVRAKKDASAVDSDKPKRGRAKKVVQVVTSGEDDVISALVAAANNTENIVISTTREEVAVVVEAPAKEAIKLKAADAKPKATEAKPKAAEAKPKAADEEAATAKQLALEAAKLAKEQAKIAADAEKASAKLAKEQAKIVADAEKAAAKLAKEQAKIVADAEKAAAKLAKEQQAKPKKEVAKPVVAVAPVVVELTNELVAEEDVDEDEEDGEGIPVDYEGTTYICEESTGRVYNTELTQEHENLTYRNGAIFEC
jgi:hypothetical protein